MLILKIIKCTIQSNACIVIISTAATIGLGTVVGVMIAGLSIVMLICIVLRIRQKTAINNTALTNGSTFSTSCM